MVKRRKRRHEVRKLPPGRAEGAGGQTTANCRAQHNGFHVEKEPPQNAELRACMALWNAVLLQQIMDAKSRSTKTEAKHYRNAAKHWLFDNERDFIMVCELAGLDPISTRRKINSAQSRDFVWNARKPQLTKWEREQQREMVRKELFEIGVLPVCERPRRAKRRGFATRGLNHGQMELVF